MGIISGLATYFSLLLVGALWFNVYLNEDFVLLSITIFANFCSALILAIHEYITGQEAKND